MRKQCIECQKYILIENLIEDYSLCIICYDTSSIVNRCLECKLDMGYCNPRQLCQKTYCDNPFREEFITSQTQTTDNQ